MVIDDGMRKVKIDSGILEQIYSYLQMEKSHPESGGILIGRENIINDNLIIENLSIPMPCDQQTRTRFIRRDQGHRSLFQQLYDDSEGTVRYVGEWHTHPEDYPHYSPIDLKNWQKIKREAKDGKSHYHIIAGRKSIAVWKCDNDKLFPVKLASLVWQDVIPGREVI